jgi:hypothetical protein
MPHIDSVVAVVSSWREAWRRRHRIFSAERQKNQDAEGAESKVVYNFARGTHLLFMSISHDD